MGPILVFLVLLAGCDWGRLQLGSTELEPAREFGIVTAIDARGDDEASRRITIRTTRGYTFEEDTHALLSVGDCVLVQHRRAGRTPILMRTDMTSCGG